MSRERLKEVHQTDLIEGRINEDFVDWLKTKGTSWLLVVVIALFVYAAIVRWRSHVNSYQSEAWGELSKAVLPSNYEDVADKYTDVGAVSQLARLRAGEQLLAAVHTGKTLAADAASATPLNDETRKDYLDKADRMFSKIVESDDKSDGMTLLATSAYNGRAAVAESRGDLDAAKRFYEQAADRASAMFPQLAAQSRDHAKNIEQQAQPATLQTTAQIMESYRIDSNPSTDPVWSEPWLDKIVTPGN